jgi:hypothetical protein
MSGGALCSAPVALSYDWYVVVSEELRAPTWAQSSVVCV